MGETQRFPAFNALLTRRGHLVPVLDKEGLRRAITEPARHAGRPLDEAVVQRLVEQSADHEGGLPLLQYALTEIWRGLEQGRPAEDTLRQCGGVGGALAGRAQEIFDELDANQQSVAKRSLLKLVRLGEGGADTRRPVAVDDLVADREPRAFVMDCLRRFATSDARFLTFGRGADGEEQVEITHDALINHWATLRDWLRENRDDLRTMARLEAAAKHWSAKGEVAGLLWRRPDLDLLRHLAGRRLAEFSGLQARFYRASLRQERRSAWVKAGAVAVLVAACGLGAWALFAEQRAALQRELNEAVLKDIAHSSYAGVDRLVNVAGTTRIVSMMIQVNVDLLDRLLARDPSDPGGLQKQQVALLRRAADAWFGLGNTAEAGKAIERLLLITQARVAADPHDRQWQRELSLTYLALGDLHRERGDSAAGLAAYGLALEISRRLEKEGPAVTEWRLDAPKALLRLGKIQTDMGDFEVAKSNLMEAQDTLQSMARADRSNKDIQMDLATARMGLIGVAFLRQDTVAAREGIQNLLEHVKQQAEIAPLDHEWQSTLALSYWINGVVVLAWEGAFGRAEESYEKAVEILEPLIEADPIDTRWPDTLADLYASLSEALYQRDDVDTALSTLQKALSLRQRLVGLDPENSLWQTGLGELLEEAAKLHQSLTDDDAAEDAFQHAVDIRKHLADAAPLDKQRQLNLADSYITLGSFLSDIADTAASREAYQSALDILVPLAAADPLDLYLQLTLSRSALYLSNLVQGEADPGDLSASRAAGEKFLSIAERMAVSAAPTRSGKARMLARMGLPSIQVVAAHLSLGILERISGETAAARDHLRKAHNVLESATAPDSRAWTLQDWRATIHRSIGDEYLALSDPSDAQDAYRNALTVIQRMDVADPENPRLQHRLEQAYGDLGRALLLGGQFAAARESSAKAHDLNPFDWRWGFDLGHTYLLAGDRTTAERYYADALEQLRFHSIPFEPGPAADFEWFIENGWEVEASRAVLAQMHSAVAQWPDPGILGWTNPETRPLPGKPAKGRELSVEARKSRDPSAPGTTGEKEPAGPNSQR